MYITNKKQFFSQTAIDDAIKYVQSKWPEEACGVFVNDEFIPFENKSENPLDTFLIDDPEFDKLYLSGDVECIIHSHEDGGTTPMASKEDQEQQQALDIPCGIINMRNKSVTHVVFWGDQLPIEPLLGRHFFFNVWDCYGLARDFIRQEFKYATPNPGRDFCFWYKGKPFMETNIETMPFTRIPLDKIQVNDFILYNIEGTKFVNHVGIYKGNRVMHHLYNQISRLLPVNDYKNFAQFALRFDRSKI